MATELKKRLGGVQDLAFDEAGAGAKVAFLDAAGQPQKVDKINAGHLPLLAATQLLTGTANVDEWIAEAHRKVAAISQISAMVEDVTVEIPADYEVAQIQSLIDRQLKNLGSYTLTFVFPETVNRNLLDTLEWSGFYDGVLILIGSDVEITDSTAIGSMIRLNNCACECRVSGFHFIRQYSEYSIEAKSVMAIYISDCLFTGTEGVPEAAIHLFCSDGEILDCQFEDETEIKIKSSFTILTEELAAGLETVNQAITELGTGLAAVDEKADDAVETANAARDIASNNVNENFPVVWGQNYYGQMGAGHNAAISSPFFAGIPMSCSKLSFSAHNGFGIFSGKLYCCGVPDNGAMGSETSQMMGWRIFNDSADWDAVSTCMTTGAAIRKKILYTWGYNIAGQLGNGTAVSLRTPTQVLLRAASNSSTPVNFIDDWVDVKGAFRFTLALTQSGDVYACGYNGYGQLGDGTVINRSYFQKVAIEPASGIAAGGGPIDNGSWFSFSGFLLSSGKIRTCGSNTEGQLGLGNTTTISTPTVVTVRLDQSGTQESGFNASNNSDWAKISCGIRHIAALTNAGALYISGHAYALGLASRSTNFRRIPVNASNPLNTGEVFVNIAAGEFATFAITNTGRIFGCGRNNNNQLGSIVASGALVPSLTLLGTGAVSVFSGPHCRGGAFISKLPQKLSGGFENSYPTLIVSGGTSEVNGTYTIVDAGIAGYAAIWQKGDYQIKYSDVNLRWELIDTASSNAVLYNQTTAGVLPVEGVWGTIAVAGGEA